MDEITNKLVDELEKIKYGMGSLIGEAVVAGRKETKQEIKEMVEGLKNEDREIISPLWEYGYDKALQDVIDKL